MKKFFLSVSLLLSTFMITANEQVITGKKAAEILPEAYKIRLKNNFKIPNYIEFRKGAEIPYYKLKPYINQFFENQDFDFRVIEELKDNLGYTHYRCKQLINQTEVALGMFIVHTKNGMIKSINGEIITDYVGFRKNITESAALQNALNFFGAQQYKWEIAQEEEWLKIEQNNPDATYYPQGELVYMHPQADFSQTPHLAYKFNIYAQQPLSRKEIYVSAETGEVIFVQDLIHEADATGTAVTGYSGTQTIVADNTGTTYRLRESGRGNGIQTYNCQQGTSYGSAIDFTDADNYWNNANANLDQYATDAHWGAEMTYDYYLTQHNRNSIDGNGFTLLSYVHYDVNFGNAFWDGQRMTYGDGSSGNNPFTALDIAGHEITHGLTSFTAALVYQNESGALNESFSDIFGVSIEWYARPNNANWTMGEDLGFIIRDMSNPNATGDPDTYQGNNWYTGTADNGGVHTNSGVQNYWYYLMVNGGSGTNDLGNTYNVTGIGFASASAIAFRNLTVYLTSSSTYTDARFYAIQSATDLFGGCSPEVGTTTDAWYAVGIGQPYSPNTVANFSADQTQICSAPATVSFTNLSVNGNTFTWNFGDGNTSTAVNPSHTYNNYGTYTVTLIADGGANCGQDTLIQTQYITIDSTLPCIVTMPNSGSAPTQSSCSGTVYDSGGNNGNYGANEDSYITIAPVGASSVSVSFPFFDIEAGSGNVCDYDFIEIFDGNSTNAPSLGKYCNTTGNPGTITSTGGAITVHFHSDPGVELSGFEMTWQCTMPTTPPTANFTADNTSTCTGLVNFTDLSTNGPTSWNWNFGDGNTSTLQNPTHQYTANGTYTVTLTATNANGSDVATQTAYITVNMPQAPVANNDTVCPNQSTTLMASATDSIVWYSDSTATTSIASGTSYTTPNLTTSTTYYVQNIVPATVQNVGKLDNSGGGAMFNNYQYLIFDALQQVEIVSVKVYANSSANRTIELRDAQGNVLQSATINIPAGTQRVTLNFTVPAGNNYQLGVSQNSTIDLYRNNNGTNYPYTIPGLISITQSSASTNPTGYYYFFYDWEVKAQDCASPLVPVTAVVDNCTPTSTAELHPNKGYATYPNPNGGQFYLTGDLSQIKQVVMYDVLGKEQKINVTSLSSRKQLIELDHFAKGVYHLVIIENNGHKVVQKLIIH